MSRREFWFVELCCYSMTAEATLGNLNGTVVKNNQNKIKKRKIRK